MTDRRQLANVAIAAALRTRKAGGYAAWQPLCPFDLATALDIEVRFATIPSMEGVYTDGPPPAIVVSSLRPAGRRAFTCAHELGHHVLGHGDQYDELVEQRGESRRMSPEEFQADCFAGALLMPKTAVMRGFSLRGETPRDCNPEMVYVVATWLGVGYTSLVNHLRYALRVIGEQRRVELLRHRPRALRERLLGEECRRHLIVVDEHWQDKSIDLEVEDVVSLPFSARIEGAAVMVLKHSTSHVLVRGATPGLSRVSVGAWASFVRVCRREFSGRGIYRFLEDVSDE